MTEVELLSLAKQTPQLTKALCALFKDQLREETEMLHGPGGADKSEQFAANLKCRYDEIESFLSEE